MTQDRNSKRRGVAILMVVGLLSILMLTAVAFSISMRVERRGAANYRHSVQARHMVWAALAEAIQDIHTDMDGANGFFVYPETAWGGTNVKGSAKVSGNDESMRAHVLSLAGREMIPAPLQDAADDVHDSRCYWHTIKGGRYAYLIVNTSGMLDANIVGGTNRAAGHSPAEIQLGIAAGDYIQRDKYVRYEVLPELKNHNAPLYYSCGTNFTVYSYAEVGDRLNSSYEGERKEDISGGYAELDAEPKRRKVKAAFEAAGVPALESEFMLKNLVDYLDEDNIPQALDKPYTEAVPMISELMVTGVVQSLPGGNAVAITRLNVEWHYPFVKATSNKFDMAATLRVTVRNTTQGLTIGPVESTAQSDSGLVGTDTETFGIKSDFVAVAPTVAADPGDNIEIECWARASVISLEESGALVDAAPFPQTDWISLGKKVVGAGPVGAAANFLMCRETIDPRFNWNEGLWPPRPTHTMGQMNWWTTTVRATKTDLDIGSAMHVSNAGKLDSVGELGHLVAGATANYLWKTLRLFEAKRGAATISKHDLLEHFTLTNGVAHGLININTRSEDVLEAAFLDCPVTFPDSAKRLSQVEVDAIVASLKSANDEYFDVGDLGLVNQIEWEDVLQGPTWDDLARESIIAHSCGLFTVRQNMFTILARAQAFSEGMGGERGQILSATRIAAEIWRDPFRSEGSGKHRCFVRFCKYIEE